MAKQHRTTIMTGMADIGIHRGKIGRHRWARNRVLYGPAALSAIANLSRSTARDMVGGFPLQRTVGLPATVRFCEFVIVVRLLH